MKQEADFKTKIAGIPCGIYVTRYFQRRGNYSPLADDPDEYFGIDEFEFKVLDRRGYEASWLQDKMTQADETRIRREFDHHLYGR